MPGGVEERYLVMRDRRQWPVLYRAKVTLRPALAGTLLWSQSHNSSLSSGNKTIYGF